MHIDASASDMRDRLSAYLDHVAATGDRVLIRRFGRELAALVTVRDLDALEKVESGREEFLEIHHARQMRDFRRMRDMLDGGD